MSVDGNDQLGSYLGSSILKCLIHGFWGVLSYVGYYSEIIYLNSCRLRCSEAQIGVYKGQIDYLRNFGLCQFKFDRNRKNSVRISGY